MRGERYEAVRGVDRVQGLEVHRLLVVHHVALHDLMQPIDEEPHPRCTGSHQHGLHDDDDDGDNGGDEELSRRGVTAADVDDRGASS